MRVRLPASSLPPRPWSLNCRRSLPQPCRLVAEWAAGWASNPKQIQRKGAAQAAPFLLRGDRIVAVDPVFAQQVRPRFLEPVEAEGAFDARPGRMQVEDLALRAGRQLNARRARAPLGFICDKGGAGIMRRPCQLAGQNISIFDRRRRALGQEWQHRMGGVTKKRYASPPPVRQGITVKQPPFEATLDAFKQDAQAAMRLGKRREHILSSAFH